MRFEFTIPGKPCGKGRPRFTRDGHAFTPQETVNYENLVKMCFRQKYPGAEPIAAKIQIAAVITAYFPIPQSVSKKKREEMNAWKILPTVKPDTDNIAKCILDALNGIAYHDDAQIVALQVRKRYAETPMVDVDIMTYEDYRQRHYVP